jgi:hypothetical protein
MPLRIGLLAVLMLLAHAPALAADLGRGIDAFERGDDDTARVELAPLARAGDREAQYVFGFMHALGRGVPADLVRAHMWFNLAASSGKSGAAEARERVATRMSPQQIATAQQMAMSFTPTPVASSGSGFGSWNQPAQGLPTGRELVRAIQQGLADLGFQPGVADGLMGRRTREAIVAFQGQRGLTPDPEPSQALLQAIRSAADEGMRASAPAPASRPAVAATAGSGDWYLRRPVSQSLDDVLASLRELLRRDDARLRQGVQRLVGGSRWPWETLVFAERFDRPAGQGALDWRVMAGEFAISDGLLSEAPSAAPAAAAPSEKERRRQAKEQIIGNLLGALLGAQQQQGTAPAPQNDTTGSAVIRLAVDAAPRFALRTRILPEQAARGMQLALVGDGGEELLLRYDAASGRLGLEQADAGGTRSLSSVPLRLDEGRSHRIEWWSARAGSLGVAVNGRAVIDNARSDLQGGYRHFEWRNDGGRYRMLGVELHTARAN